MHHVTLTQSWSLFNYFSLCHGLAVWSLSCSCAESRPLAWLQTLRHGVPIFPCTPSHCVLPMLKCGWFPGHPLLPWQMARKTAQTSVSRYTVWRWCLACSQQDGTGVTVLAQQDCYADTPWNGGIQYGACQPKGGTRHQMLWPRQTRCILVAWSPLRTPAVRHPVTAPGLGCLVASPPPRPGVPQ